MSGIACVVSKRHTISPGIGVLGATTITAVGEDPYDADSDQVAISDDSEPGPSTADAQGIWPHFQGFPDRHE